MNRRIVVFAPHADDETLGCGGTILKKISEGYDVFIVVLTDGRNALSLIFDITSNPTPEELIQIRRKELFCATAKLNVPKTNLVLFDFEDGKLGNHIDEAKNKVLEVITRTNPTEVFFPYHKDFNKDHQATNRIVTECVEQSGLPTLKYQYSIAQKFSRISPIVDKMFNTLRHNLLSINISDFLKQKELAIREYRSQVTIISRNQERPVVNDFSSFLKNHEIFYI